MANKNFLDYIPDLALRNSIQAKTCTVNLAEYFLVCRADIQNGDFLTIPPGDYYTTRGLELSNISNVEVSAYGATIVCHSDVPIATKFNYMDSVEHAVANTFGMRIIACSNVFIKGLALNGNAYLIPHDAWPMTGYVLNSQDVVLYDCSKHNCKGMFKISGACTRCGTVNWNEYNNHWGHTGAKHIGFREFVGTGNNDLLAESDLISVENNPNYLNRHILIEITYAGTSAADPATYRWSDNSTTDPIVWYGADPDVGDNFPCTSLRTSIPGSQPISGITVPGPFVSWSTTFNKPIGDKWWFTFIYSCQSRFGFNAKDLFTGEQFTGVDNFHRNFRWSGGNQNIPNCRGQERFIYDGITSYPANSNENLVLKYLMPANGTETLNAYGNKSVTVRNSITAGIDFFDIEELEITNLRILPNPWCGISLWATHAGVCYRNVALSNILMTNINDFSDGNRWDYIIGTPYAYSQGSGNQFMVYHCGIALSGHGTFENVNINNIHIDQSGVDENSLPYRTIGLAPVPFSPTFRIDNLSIDTISSSSNVQTLVHSDWLPYWDHSNKNLAITSTESSTFQSSFTLQGTCNSTTDYIKVSLNNSTKFQVVFPVNNEWSYTAPNLSFGINTFHLIGINLLTKQETSVYYELTFALPIITEDGAVPATPFIMTLNGLRQVFPRIVRNGKVLNIKTYVGIQSLSATLTGCSLSASLGDFTIQTPSNGVILTGVQGVGAIGYIGPTLNDECLLEGVYGTGEYGSLISEIVPTIELVGVYGTGEYGSLIPEIHTPGDYDLTPDQLYVTATAANQTFYGPNTYTAPFPITRVYVGAATGGAICRVTNEAGVQVGQLNNVTGWITLMSPLTSIRINSYLLSMVTPPFTHYISKVTY